MLKEMLRNRYFVLGGIVLILLLANIICHIWENWGLITVKVTDAPLSKVIKSIEWQGWVKIYTNAPPDTKVSMYVDHVPLAEAMETLAVNVTGTPVGDDPAADAARRQARARAAGGAGAGGAGAGGRGDFGGGAGGANGGGRGAGGAGGERTAQWNLAFFVAPTSGEVKQEISDFESGVTADDAKIYSYPTSLQMVATEDEMPASDPRLQVWPGYKPPPPPPAPVADASGATPAPPAPADPPDSGPPTVQTYLDGIAQEANVWIMAPGSWTPAVEGPPPPSSSIISAVKELVSRAHGAVAQVLILRLGRNGTGGGRGFANMDAMEDRIDNVINGLPPEYQAPARAELQQDVTFLKKVQTVPQEQRRQMLRDFFASKRGRGDNSWRRSPAQRAQRYARVVSNRMTAQGKK